jgi:hypothetical protein
MFILIINKLVKRFLLNPLQIYTDYVATQAVAREKRIFVDNLRHLLIKMLCFTDNL